MFIRDDVDSGDQPALLPLKAFLQLREAERSEYAVRMTQDILKLDPSVSDGPDGLRLLARMTTRSGKLNLASRNWERLAEVAELTQEDDLEYCYCLARSGQTKAHEMLARLEVGEADGFLIERLRKFTLKTAIDFAGVTAAHLRGSEALWRHGDVDAYLAETQRAARAAHYQDDGLTEVGAVCRLLSTFAEAARVGGSAPGKVSIDTNDDQPRHPDFILCSGFGWSGSGAVFDYLSDFEGLQVFSHSEMGAFHTQGIRVLQSILNLETCERIPADELLRAVFDYFSIAVLGFPSDSKNASIPRIVQSPLMKAMRKTRRMRGVLPGLMSSAVAGILEAVSGGQADGRASRFIAEFWRQVKLAKVGPINMALLNNVTRSFNTPTLVDVGLNIRTFAVTRDPRDQFVDIASRKKTNVPVEKFISSYREKQRKHDAAARRIGASRLRLIHFDQFVLDQDFRLSVARDIFGDGVQEGGRKFDPEASRRNIGIFRDWPVRSDITRIEKELTAYLREI